MKGTEQLEFDASIDGVVEVALEAVASQAVGVEVRVRTASRALLSAARRSAWSNLRRVGLRGQK